MYQLTSYHYYQIFMLHKSLKALASVKHEHAYYRACTSLSLWLIFLAWLSRKVPNQTKNFFDFEV